MSTNFTTPIGRFLSGDVFTPNTTDMAGKPLTTRAGAPRSEYAIGVAFPKSDPASVEFIRAIHAVAAEGFPAMFPGGACNRPTFSFKYVDGDSAVPNQKGKVPNTREGYPGNYVCWFSSSYAPGVYDRNRNEILDPQQIQKGYYVRVAGSISANGNEQYPGVYVNLGMVMREAFGAVIRSGPDVATAFAVPVVLPAGASMTPLAPMAPVAGPTTPLAPMAPVAAPMAPAAAPMAPAAAPMAPAPTVAAPVMVPVPMIADPVAPTTLPGCPHTYGALQAAGYTEEQMRAAGFIA